MAKPIRSAAAAALLLVGVLGVSPRVAAQQAGEPRISFNAAQLTISGRVQTQFNTTTAEDEPTAEMILRRVRLEATVKVNEIVSGKVQPDFAGDEVSVKDAYVRFGFSPGFSLLAGKAHRPFSLLEQTSSARMPPIERGVRIRGVPAAEQYRLISSLEYSDRDIGLQVLGSPAGAPLGLSYAAGVFPGPLYGEVGSAHTYQFAARTRVSPVDRVAIGAAWSSRDFVESEVGGSFGLERGHAWEVDVEYGAFAPGLHLLGEVAWGDADPVTDSDFLGAQAWLAYRTGALGRASAIEPIFRVSHGRLDGGPALGGTLLTPGINIYFGPLNRVMFDYDFWRAEAGPNAGSFKAMFQMVF